MGKSLQALHTFGQLILFFLADPLKHHRCSMGFKSGLWLGHSETCPKATPVLSWLYTSGHCRAERWTVTPVWGHMHSGAGFLQGPLCIWLHSSFPQFWWVSHVPATERHPHSTILPPPCFTVGMALGRWWAVPGVPQTEFPRSSAQRVLLSHQRESFPSCSLKCHLANSKQAVSCLLLKSGFLRSYSVWPDWPTLGRVLVVSNFFHFTITEATVLLGTPKALEIILYPCPDLCHTTTFRSTEFLGLHGLVFVRTCSVNCGTLCTWMFAFLNYVHTVVKTLKLGFETAGSDSTWFHQLRLCFEPVGSW